jgi:mRNA-degrading endonuclease toxin of MazEF toxin-antitoxin module
VSKQRLAKFCGRVSPDTLREIEDRLRVLLGM